MLILSAADVRRALPMPQAIEAMKRAFASLSEGRTLVPPRTHLPVVRHAGVTLVMPAFIDAPSPADQALAVKVVSVFDHNAQRGLPRIQAAVLACDPETGQPRALLEGAALTAIRTAAASGAATDFLARPDSQVLAMFGAGVQARAHVEAMCAVRPIRTVYVYCRSPARCRAFIEELQPACGAKMEWVVAQSPQQALKHADIVCTATTSSRAVFDDTDVGRGVHLNAIGAYTPETCEIPAETVRRAAVFVDNREAAWTDAGDLIQPFRAGLVDRGCIVADLGELALGRHSGRADSREITLFKSVGLAVQDAVAARCTLENARRLNLGREVDW